MILRKANPGRSFFCRIMKKLKTRTINIKFKKYQPSFCAYILNISREHTPGLADSGAILREHTIILWEQTPGSADSGAISREHAAILLEHTPGSADSGAIPREHAPILWEHTPGSADSGWRTEQFI